MSLCEHPCPQPPPSPPQVSKSQADTGANHAISALKFGIIKKFLQLGWSVLLSDIDVCVLQDPFKFLYRCAAVTRGCGQLCEGSGGLACGHALNGVTSVRHFCPQQVKSSAP